MFTSTPKQKTEELAGAPERIRVSGSSGTRMVFSWTWNENRKKAMDEVRSVYGNNGRKGGAIDL